MKKKLLLVLFAVLLMGALLLLSACEKPEKPADGEEESALVPTEGLYYELNEAGTAYSLKGIGIATDTDIVVPSEYEGKPVTEIAAGAFRENETVTSLTISNGIAKIGTNAFSRCPNLTSVSFPKTLTSIGNGVWGAFYGCPKLTSITVEEGNPVYCSDGKCVIHRENKELVLCAVGAQIPTDGSVTRLGNHVFAYRDDITALDLPAVITKIGYYSYEGCKNLKEIVIPSTVEEIGMYAFSRCTGLETVRVSEGVTSIGDGAFESCTSLTAAYLPKGIYYLCSGVFNNVENATIYLAEQEKPTEGIWSVWNPENLPVVWGYTETEE